MSKNTIGLIVAVIVTMVWLAAGIGSAIRRDYTALSIITPVMLTALGWLYYKRGNGNGK